MVEIASCNHEMLVRRIREAGECIIKNAESIAGNEKYISDLYIIVDITTTNSIPKIVISKNFVPEKFIENSSYYDYRQKEE